MSAAAFPTHSTSVVRVTVLRVRVRVAVVEVLVPGVAGVVLRRRPVVVVGRVDPNCSLDLHSTLQSVYTSTIVDLPWKAFIAI